MIGVPSDGFRTGTGVQILGKVPLQSKSSQLTDFKAQFDAMVRRACGSLTMCRATYVVQARESRGLF